MAPGALILGCAGGALSARERDFFRAADPWGFIIFARNVESPDQLAALTAEMRAAVGRQAPVLVDQEGGRVQRLRPPHWRAFRPAMAECEGRPLEVAAEALVLRYRLIAHELNAAGVDVNCAPLLDVATPDLHQAIGDRALARDGARVGALGHAVRRGLMAGGVLPVVKHLPGYGRADVDPHLSLPVVSASRAALEQDFAPFRAHADAPMGMTAHLMIDAVDAEYPVTFSGPCIDLIRDEIGFQGLLMTDDISMGALQGSIAERVTASLDAGCDIVLHCNGDMAEMEAAAEAAGRLEGRALARARAVDALPRAVEEIDIAEVERRYRALDPAKAGAHA
ncbi:glycoside hydrolase family 3 N-terminal domain-containing protein [Pikeienuella sp. HZG-20]|uniref:glycoside hydrolase family 3 N-terminal domain-containing protein n=1 Tax=Paludibacillus litoralis TaxID=3133267 RepID=UPI0030ED22AE